MGDAAQPRRHHLPQTAGCRQGWPERKEGAGPDAGAALYDQAPGAGGRRQAAGRLHARHLCEGSRGKIAKKRPARQTLAELDDVARVDASWPAMEQGTVDDGAKLWPWHRVMAAHQVLDLEFAVLGNGLQ